MGYAYGNTYIGNQISKRSHRRNLDETPFVIYEPKKTQEAINQNDGFVNIPDGIDDELPFN
ncbi:MAG: hypothetical protein J6A75_08385 [Lachnospiraceae bacterium]|nr:hypothetical protein [Lachnospiraceae bacterium]